MAGRICRRCGAPIEAYRSERAWLCSSCADTPSRGAVGHNNRKQIVAIAECRACQTLRSAEEGNFAQTVAAVAMRLEAAGELRALLGGGRDCEVARHGTETGARDLHRVDAGLRIAALHLHALGLDRNELQTLGLRCPEGIEVLGLRMGLELVDLHAGAAIEEDAAVTTLEFVLGALALRRRRVARVLLAVDLALAVDELGAHADKPRTVERRLDHDRLREIGRHLLAELLAVVAEALPVDEPLTFRQLLDFVQLERERHLLARSVVDRALIRGTAQKAVIQLTSEGGRNRQCEHLNGIQIFSIRIHIQTFLPRYEYLRPHPKNSIQFLKAKVRESFSRYCNYFAHNSNASDVHLFSLEVFFDITLDIVFELLALKNIHVVYESYYEPSGGLAPKDISREYPRISAID